jgi:hypothetical protein
MLSPSKRFKERTLSEANVRLGISIGPFEAEGITRSPLTPSLQPLGGRKDNVDVDMGVPKEILRHLPTLLERDSVGNTAVGEDRKTYIIWVSSLLGQVGFAASVAR